MRHKFKNKSVHNVCMKKSDIMTWFAGHPDFGQAPHSEQTWGRPTKGSVVISSASDSDPTISVLYLKLKLLIGGEKKKWFVPMSFDKIDI